MNDPILHLHSEWYILQASSRNKFQILTRWGSAERWYQFNSYSGTEHWNLFPPELPIVFEPVSIDDEEWDDEDSYEDQWSMTWQEKNDAYQYSTSVRTRKKY